MRRLTVSSLAVRIISLVMIVIASAFVASAALGQDDANELPPIEEFTDNYCNNGKWDVDFCLDDDPFQQEYKFKAGWCLAARDAGYNITLEECMPDDVEYVIEDGMLVRVERKEDDDDDDDDDEPDCAIPSDEDACE
jgi:hypothetical protein